MYGMAAALALLFTSFVSQVPPRPSNPSLLAKILCPYLTRVRFWAWDMSFAFSMANSPHHIYLKDLVP